MELGLRRDPAGPVRLRNLQASNGDAPGPEPFVRAFFMAVTNRVSETLKACDGDTRSSAYHPKFRACGRWRRYALGPAGQEQVRGMSTAMRFDGDLAEIRFGCGLSPNRCCLPPASAADDAVSNLQGAGSCRAARGRSADFDGADGRGRGPYISLRQEQREPVGTGKSGYEAADKSRSRTSAGRRISAT